jgi:glutathione S-transferase
MLLREPIGESTCNKIRWMLPTLGVPLEVMQVSVRREHFSALMTLCLRALPQADST